MKHLIVVSSQDSAVLDKRACVNMDTLKALLKKEAGDKQGVIDSYIPSGGSFLSTTQLLESFEKKSADVKPANADDGLTQEQRQQKADYDFLIKCIQPFAAKDEELAAFFAALLEYECRIASYAICYEVSDNISRDGDSNDSRQEDITVFSCDSELPQITFEDFRGRKLQLK